MNHSRNDPGAGPLSGLRVIDLTSSYAGPTASMYLADLGADVVKVERPGSGDDARSWGPPFAEGESAWFASANRNKRSIVINLSSPEGPSVLHRIIGEADVFMQNLNPSKLARLGISADVLCERFPRLIYCAISGFGLDGPARDLPGYDLVAQARSGLMSVTGETNGSPQRVSTALSDVVTGMCAALAISAARVRQQVTGLGDVIDVSLLDSDLALMAPRIAAYLAGEPEPAPSGGTDSVLAVYQKFPTADRDIVIAIGNDPMWRRFCLVVGLENLSDDEALGTNAGRRLHRARIAALVGERLAERTAAEWLALLGAADIPSSTVQSLSEVVHDRHVQARGSLLPIPDSDVLFGVRSPFRFESLPNPRNNRFPAVGADTSDVMRELGITDEEIRRLSSIGAIGLGEVTLDSTTVPALEQEGADING